MTFRHRYRHFTIKNGPFKGILGIINLYFWEKSQLLTVYDSKQSFFREMMTSKGFMTKNVSNNHFSKNDVFSTMFLP